VVAARTVTSDVTGRLEAFPGTNRRVKIPPKVTRAEDVANAHEIVVRVMPSGLVDGAAVASAGIAFLSAGPAKAKSKAK
jgi:sugar lactone lactonase YvrE